MPSTAAQLFAHPRVGARMLVVTSVVYLEGAYKFGEKQQWLILAEQWLRMAHKLDMRVHKFDTPGDG